MSQRFALQRARCARVVSGERNRWANLFLIGSEGVKISVKIKSAAS